MRTLAAAGTDAHGLRRADRRKTDWLFMILVNFASKLMKYTSQGSVTIGAISMGQSRLRFEASLLCTTKR